ncbi:response regulator transcription factor [Roseomonas frigidaquae]|uniref:Response regulator transcription factor n=1 Tax=Falsiroseomonas frigidaquae TaxID=487318 RepID=A0ABX1F425_9PROT|nr:response regulator transcription factor [Falsiroseomonas frigidaquae]
MTEALIHLVEDDAALRTALLGLFRSAGMDVQAYASGREFLAAPRPDRPGCIVLDVKLPDMSGLDLQERLLGLGIGLPAILMTGHGDIPMSVRAMRAGAVDFLAKPFRDHEMLDAVELAVARDRIRRAAQQDLLALRLRHASLSVREREVMALVAAGCMNKQVAHKLGLSEITVKIHRASAMRKMEAKSLADLVRLAALLDAGPPVAD